MDLYIILGAAGFLGNNLIRILNERTPEAEVRALSLPGEDRASLAGLKCNIYDADVTKPETFKEAFRISKDYDHIFVINCAGVIDIGSKPNPKLHHVNVDGVRNLIDQVFEMQKQGLPIRFLYVGSVHAIPELPKGQVMTEVEHFDPDLVVGQYAKSKAAASQLIMKAAERGLDAVILEPSGLLGPYNFGPENMKELFHQVAKGKLRACVPGGYNFVDVRDVAEGILAACVKGQAGRSYILAGEYDSMLNICQRVCSLAGNKPIQIMLPLKVAALAAPLCEAYYRARNQVPLFTRYAVETVDANGEFSSRRAEEELGYGARPLETTVADMLRWMEQQPDW